jgi:AraC-like DNA-binding protein
VADSHGMEKDFGIRAIQNLQQAYGFSVDRPLWDSRKLFEVLTVAYPGLSEIHCPKKTQVQHVMNSWTVGSAAISAGSHSETFARASKTGATTITIQYAGNTHYVQEGQHLHGRALQNAMLLVDAPGTALTEDVSSLVLAFNPEAVRSTAGAMFNDDAIELELFPHIIEFKTAQERHYVANLPLTLAALSSYPRLSEDTLHRFIAQLIARPNKFGKRAQRRTQKTNQLDLACAYMMDQLHNEITLTDLEQLTLLSSRTLQMEFLARFGVTPMTWLLHRRLERAYQLLQKSESQTIAALAMQCGFRHMGRFSAAFRNKFGISPSALVRRGALH